jgi:hypothetical protein
MEVVGNQMLLPLFVYQNRNHDQLMPSHHDHEGHVFFRENQGFKVMNYV